MTYRIIGLNEDPLPQVFFDFAEANKASWEDYVRLEDLTRQIYNTGLLLTPATGDPRAMLITQLDIFPSGLRQCTVIWTGGSTDQADVHALAQGVEHLASYMSCTRIAVNACDKLYRQMKREGYRAVTAELIKDLPNGRTVESNADN